MKSLYSSLLNTIYEGKVLKEYSILEGEEMLQINESFQSSILIALAKAIKDAEKGNAENDKRLVQQYKDQGYSGTPSKSAKSFASIFGPITLNQRWGKEKTGLQGLKWSEIKDDDFELYKSVSTDDKTFAKTLKDCYSKKIQANFICCEPGTKNVIIFIKGYSNTPGDVRVFGLKSKYGNRDAVTEKTERKYKYGERSLKFDEAMAVISGLDVYVLKITDNMKTEYTKLYNTRMASQKGVINYDEESLKQLRKNQVARYRTLADEIRAKKLQSDPNVFWDEIKKTNDEVIALYAKIMGSVENLDKRFELGRLMNYVAYAYDAFYDFVKYNRDSEVHKERAKARAAEKGEEFDDKTYDKYDFDKTNSKQKINDAKKYIDTVKKMIEEIEDNL